MSIESVPTHSNRLVLTSAQRELLRHALQSSKNGDGEFGRRHAIREFCSVGRKTNQRPEQLVISFKESLVAAADEASLPYGPQRRELLARMVSIFIEELYGVQIRKPADEREAPLDRF